VDDPPSVAVIIPVYNQAKLLARCLAALGEQTYPADRMEVIVVDTASTDELPELIRSTPGVRFLHETRPGSYAARNLALANANAEIIAFTDADCIPDPAWLQHGVERLQHTPDCGLLAGRIELFPEDQRHPTAVECYELLTAFRQHEYASRHYGATANVLTRRAVFDDVGPFNDTLFSGGDQEWGKRVHACGYAVVYDYHAVVRHPARRSFADLRRKKRRVIGGEYDRTRTMPHDRMIWRIKLLRGLVPPAGTVRFIFRDPRLRGFGQRSRTALVALAVHYLQTWERWRLQFGGRSVQ
jgi:glycosyltransferase involved in cell wall biosynthesis